MSEHVVTTTIQLGTRIVLDFTHDGLLRISKVPDCKLCKGRGWVCLHSIECEECAKRVASEEEEGVPPGTYGRPDQQAEASGEGNAVTVDPLGDPPARRPSVPAAPPRPCQRKRRAKRKGDTTPLLPDEYTPGFEEWWRTICTKVWDKPRQGSKRPAFRAWWYWVHNMPLDRMQPYNTRAERLLHCAYRYARHCRKEEIPMKHVSTFLSVKDRHWEDWLAFDGVRFAKYGKVKISKHMLTEPGEGEWTET